MSKATEVLQEWFSGHRRGALADDVVFRDMSFPIREVRGPEAVERFLDGLYGAFEESGARTRRVHEVGEETVVIEFTFWGRGLKHGMGPLMGAGSSGEMPICAVYRVPEGRITEISVYHDTHALLAQLH